MPFGHLVSSHLTPAWIAAAVLAVAAAVLLLGVRARVERAARKDGLATALGRLAAGIDLLHGRDHQTNAGWLTRPGEVALVGAGAKRGRASWWQHQNYLFRTICRCGWVPAAAVWYLGVEWALAALLAAAVTGFYARTRTRPGWLSWSWVPRLRGEHHGDRVQPLAEALATITGTSPRGIARGLRWNPDYAESSPGDEVLTWDYPPAFKAVGGAKGTVVDLIETRVGFGLSPSWQTSASPPRLVLKRARSLPPIVMLAGLLDRLDALPESKTGIGLNDHDELVCWDWACETPHGVVNAGSRHGKSELNKAIVCQILRKGGSVTAIDVKEVSFLGLEGLPGFTLFNDPGDIPAMWAGIAEFAAELNVRRAERIAGTATTWPRKVLIIEEANQFGEMSNDVWEGLGIVDHMDPEERRLLEGTELWKTKASKRTPAFWRHVKAVAWQGAAFGMHVIIDGQDMQASVIPKLRNSLGMRLLGGYLPQQWKFLVGTTPVPAAPAVKGRFCLVIGNSQTWIQAILGAIDADESSAIWRDYALNGREDPGRDARPSGGTPPPGRVPAGDSNRRQAAGDRPSPQASAGNGDAPSPMTGGEAAIPMPLLQIVRLFLAPAAGKADQDRLAAALKQDRQRSDKGQLRDLTFPGPVGTDGQAELFLPHQVIAFNERRRPAARQGR